MTKDNKKSTSCSRWWGEKHEWGKWEVYEKGEVIMRRFGMNRKTGNYIYQKRMCNICGKTELNYQEI